MDIPPSDPAARPQPVLTPATATRLVVPIEALVEAMTPIDVRRPEAGYSIRLTRPGSDEPLEATSPRPLPPGTRVTLQPEGPDRARVLATRPPSATVGAVAMQALRNELPRQQPVAEALSAIFRIATPASAQLPAPIGPALAELQRALPEAQELTEPARLAQALANSGSFLEPRLAEVARSTLARAAAPGPAPAPAAAADSAAAPASVAAPAFAATSPAGRAGGDSTPPGTREPGRVPEPRIATGATPPAVLSDDPPQATAAAPAATRGTDIRGMDTLRTAWLGLRRLLGSDAPPPRTPPDPAAVSAPGAAAAATATATPAATMPPALSASYAPTYGRRPAPAQRLGEPPGDLPPDEAEPRSMERPLPAQSAGQASPAARVPQGYLDPPPAPRSTPDTTPLAVGSLVPAQPARAGTRIEAAATSATAPIPDPGEAEPRRGDSLRGPGRDAATAQAGRNAGLPERRPQEVSIRAAADAPAPPETRNSERSASAASTEALAARQAPPRALDEYAPAAPEPAASRNSPHALTPPRHHEIRATRSLASQDPGPAEPAAHEGAVTDTRPTDPGSVLRDDLKARLLVLRELLSTFAPSPAPVNPPVPRTRGTVEPASEEADDALPLYSPRGLRQENVPVHGQADVLRAARRREGGDAVPEDDTIVQLLRYVEGALARTRVQQLTRLPETRPAQESAPPALWIAEIPFQGPRGLETLQLQVEREPAPARNAISAPAAWRVLLRLELGDTGPVHALVQLRGRRVGATLWAERGATFRAAKAGLAELATMLRQQGVEVEQLDCRQGAPPLSIIPACGPLLDVRT